MGVKMNLRIITKNHEAEPEKEFLTKSILKPYGRATAMPLGWELMVTVTTFLKTACEMWSFPDRSRFPFVCPVKMYSRP